MSFTRTKPIKIDDVEISIGSLTVEEVRELILKDMDASGDNGYFTGPVYDKQFSVVCASLNHAEDKLHRGESDRIQWTPEMLPKTLDPIVINRLFTEILAFHELVIKASAPGESSAAATK